MNFRDTRARRDHLARFYNRILACAQALGQSLNLTKLVKVNKI